jgi:hypothetical protein
MKTVYSSPSLALVTHFRAVLESEGIACFIRNEYLSGAAGELPPVECWPGLCVEDSLEPRARRAIARAQCDAAPPRPAWTCPGCGEDIEGQFTDCWNCGAGREG